MTDLNLSPGQLRVSDAERERVADLLADHHAAGRLTYAELDERLTTIWSARTRDELAAPLADLPAARPVAPLTPDPAVRRRTPAEIGWRVHLASYLAVILGLWLVWALTGAGYPWPIWTMMGWGLGLLGHRAQLGACGGVRPSTPG
jgi:hypothetical protein